MRHFKSAFAGAVVLGMGGAVYDYVTSQTGQAVALEVADPLLAQIGMDCHLALQDPIGPRSFTPRPDSDDMCAQLRLRIDTTSANKDQIDCLEKAVEHPTYEPEDEDSDLNLSLSGWTFSDGDVQLTISVAQDDTCHIIWHATPLGYEPEKSE
ncbi:MAG: hypothetical protein WC777_05275 [Candidatus Gracilibacteria bacterium]|jgi:hypothetical protein